LFNKRFGVREARVVKNYCLKRTVLRQNALASAVIFVAFIPVHARAASIQLGEYTITLQSTLSYALGNRTAPVNNELANLNNDDGDRNFRYGIMENRFQTLEQLNIRNGDYGFRGSALGWIDTTYLQNNKNNSPNTFNAYDVGPQGFPSATVANQGRRIEPLAAFIYGAEYFNNGNDKLSWQVGRQTITWGESLFAPDGIASLQAPIDFYLAEITPNAQLQSVFLPTGAASGSYHFASGLTVAAYWQFEFEPDVLPGAGSYFGSVDEAGDIIGPGAQRLLITPVNEGAVAIYRAADIRPENGLDQFGFSAHKQINASDIGLYFVRGISKVPGAYISEYRSPVMGPAGPSVGQYNLVYAKPTNAYAVSGSTLLGSANIAGEISGRTNQPLHGEGVYASADPANYNNQLYAAGDVIDAQLSTIYTVPPLPLLTNGGLFLAEGALNRVVSVTVNKAVLTPTAVFSRRHLRRIGIRVLILRSRRLSDGQPNFLAIRILTIPLRAPVRSMSACKRFTRII
jgi:hypothetical protein